MTDFERFNAVLSYDPETGILTWRCSVAQRVKAGSEAGSITVDSHLSYRRIRVRDRAYPAHRVAWLLMTGSWPLNQIDHIDGNGLNNRFANLRDVTQSENQKNAQQRIDNTSGVTGVAWHKKTEKWMVRAMSNGKSKHIGLFSTIEEATAARQSANEQYGFSKRHGTTH